MSKVIPMSPNRFRAALISLALTHVGRRERTGHNDVFVWDQIRTVGPNLNGQPWCAGEVALVLWLLTGGKVKKNNSGLETWDYYNAFYTPSMLAYAKKHKLLVPRDKAQDGDIRLFDFPGGNVVDHTGFAYPDERASGYRSIEGNTSSGSRGSQANGDGVFVRYRPGGVIRATIDVVKYVESFGYRFEPPVPATGTKPTVPAKKPGTTPSKAPTAPARARARTRGPFPLPTGHWFGVDDGTALSHSGARAADREGVRQIQAVVGATVDGSFGAGTLARVAAWQKAHKLTADGQVGPTTWAAMSR